MYLQYCDVLQKEPCADPKRQAREAFNVEENLDAIFSALYEAPYAVNKHARLLRFAQDYLGLI